MTFTRCQASFYIPDELIKICPRHILHHVDIEGWSVLAHAIAASVPGDPLSWAQLLTSIVETYTVPEINSCVLQTGTITYLHLAVTLMAVVAARVLVKAGANANIKAQDETQITPLRLCGSGHDMPLEMWKLLITHGDDLHSTQTRSDSTPLTTVIMMLYQNPLSAELLQSIEDLADDRVMLSVLDQLLRTSIFNSQPAMLDILIWALFRPQFRKHVNSTNEQGITMLHQAAFRMHVRAVGALLEAGADPTIPLPIPKFTVLPLQILCYLGRHTKDHWWDVELEDAEFEALDKSAQKSRFSHQAVTSAVEILEYHVTRNDAVFRGITALHILRQMHVTHVAEENRAVFQDFAAKGVWPGLEYEVTPDELGRCDFYNEAKATLRFLRDWSRDHVTRFSV